MIDIPSNEKKGLVFLGIARIMLGFMFLWAFFDKLLGLGMPSTYEAGIIHGGSPTEYYLTCLVDGPFAGMWNALAGNAFIDFMLMFGLLTVGVTMILGIASKLSTIGFTVMCILMYMLNLPPSDNPIVDYHILYAVVGLAIYCLGGYRSLGLEDVWKETKLVKSISLLE